MNDEQRENVKKLLRAMGMRPYADAPRARTGAAVWADYAERELWGRSHYYDAGTRRYFGCRVHEAGALLGGAYLLTLESVTPPDANGGRRYRPVLFDPLGETIRLGLGERRAHRLAELPETDCKPPLDADGWAALDGARQAVRAWRARGWGQPSVLWDHLLGLAGAHAQRLRKQADDLSDTHRAVPRFFSDMEG